MSGTTPNLNLFVYDPTTDGALTFNITQALTNNFNIIDSYAASLNTNKFDKAGGILSGALKLNIAQTNSASNQDLFFVYDNDSDKPVVRMRGTYDITNWKSRFQLTLYDAANFTSFNFLTCDYDFQGNASMYGITPSITSDSSEIATTHFVNLLAPSEIDCTAKHEVTNIDLGQASGLTWNLGTGDHQYLPNDYTTNRYEVFVSVEGKSGNTVDNEIEIQFKSDLVYEYFCVAKAKTSVTNKPEKCAWSGWVPIAKGGYFYINRNTSFKGTIEKIKFLAYRRIR